MATSKTRSTRRAPSKKMAKAKRNKVMVKRTRTKATKANGKVTKANRKARKNGHGGGKALTDFGNAQKLRVLKPKEIPSRRGCFKTGQTVSACLASQKANGYRGRRKFIRTQIAAGRVSLK